MEGWIVSAAAPYVNLLQLARGTSGSIGLLARLVVIAGEGMSARTEANCAAVVGGEFSQVSRVGYPVRPGLVPFLLCACLPYLLETRSLTGKQLLFPSGHQGKGGLRAARPGKAPSESGAGSLTPPCAWNAGRVGVKDESSGKLSEDQP